MTTAATSGFSGTTDQVANQFINWLINNGGITGLNSTATTTAGNLVNSGMTNQDYITAISFAQNFDNEIQAMNSGVTDFTKSAEAAAETTANQLTTAITNFNNEAAVAGLDTQAAADATRMPSRPSLV